MEKYGKYTLCLSWDNPEYTWRIFEKLRVWYIGLIPYPPMYVKHNDHTFEVINLKHTEVTTMPKQTQKTTPKTREGNPEFIGFVNIRLSDEELNEVDKLLPKADTGTLVECLDRLLEVGKVSFNWQKGSMNITLTVMEGKQAGYAVSAFSDSLNEAILILSVKVRNYLDSFSEIYSKGGTRTRRG